MANLEVNLNSEFNVPRTIPLTLQTGQIDILLDGYISYTLTPRHAEEYFKRFMRCLESERNGTLVACDVGWVVVRSAIMPRQQQQQQQQSGYRHGHKLGALPVVARTLRLPLEDAHSELFDCKVDLSPGTIVPQPTWIGVTEHTGVFCPIFFIQRSGVLGVQYKNREVERGLLHNATTHAPGLLKRTKQNVRMRLKWPGYKQFHYEFRILDRKLGRQVPITIARLVERVARGLHRLYLEGEREPSTFKEQWELGGDGIQLEEINIIGLLHISKGTWMPILQLSRHIIPRCDFDYDNLKASWPPGQHE